ncbi:phage antirepressor KilAC domain-containing protein [uncultured Gilvimarinus sp.]|uniref:phage antirepressor KilAC domain-containing protein n=1 Tax=uncultured Gilvimarinus sp. TaxID=1689143 RepID=UPI0030DBBAFC
MSHAITPAGMHDANSARQLLGVSKKALLKHMRELGWLMVGGDSHNLPHPDYTRNGYLCSQERGYCLRGKKEIGKSYRVMLLTQKGFQALKQTMPNQKASAPAPAATAAPAPKIAPATTNPAGVTHNNTITHFNRHRADAERRRALQNLQEMGFTINQSNQ